MILGNLSLSKQSSVSTEDLDENDDDDQEITCNDSSKRKTKCFRTPFMFRILKLNAPEWSWILLGAIGSIIYGASQPIFALFFSFVYGLFAEPNLQEQKHLTSVYAGIIFAIGFTGGVSLFVSTVAFSKSGEELTMRMRKLTFAALLRQEIGYFDDESNSVGALVTRLSTDASALKVNNIIDNDLAIYIYLQGMTGMRIGIILQALSAAVTALIIAFSSGWQLALVIMCFIPLMLFSGKIQGQKQGKAGQAKDKDSFIEQGGQVATNKITFSFLIHFLHFRSV